MPGFDFLQPGATAARALFDTGTVDRYQQLTRALAIPYRISRGRHTPSEYPPYGFDAAGGLVATARDLANFEASLDDQENGDNIPISYSTLDQMWKPLVFRDPVNGYVFEVIDDVRMGRPEAT